MSFLRFLEVRRKQRKMRRSTITTTIANTMATKMKSFNPRNEILVVISGWASPPEAVIGMRTTGGGSVSLERLVDEKIVGGI